MKRISYFILILATLTSCFGGGGGQLTEQDAIAARESALDALELAESIYAYVNEEDLYNSGYYQFNDGDYALELESYDEAVAAFEEAETFFRECYSNANFKREQADQFMKEAEELLKSYN